MGFMEGFGGKVGTNGGDVTVQDVQDRMAQDGTGSIEKSRIVWQITCLELVVWRVHA